MSTPGQRFRDAVAQEKPLQVVGAVNAYAARLAEHSGFKALYLSGGGVAACSCGIPDLGITTLEDVLIDVRRITDALQPAAAGGHRYRLGGRFQYRPRRTQPGKSRRRCRAYRRPGAAKALRPPPQQSHCQPGRNGRPRQGGGGLPASTAW